MGGVDYATINLLAAEAGSFTVERYEQFARYLRPGTRRVLDVGCSVGIGGEVLRRARPTLDVVGFDCVGERLVRLPDGAYLAGVCGLTTHLPYADASVDAVVAGEFIEHLVYRDALDTLAEFRRVVRPGGRLLMTTPNPDSLRIRLTGGTMLGGAHLSAHYPKQLAQMLLEVGFGPASWRGSGRASRLVGERFPFLTVYGSYLIWADAPG